jgi:hypothetical protein
VTLGLTEILAGATAIVSILGGFGATVKWAASKFEKQGQKLAGLEREYATLYRESSLVMVQLERFRLAFQMVASELSRKSPGNEALLRAKSLLDQGFKIDPDISPDMQEILDRIDDEPGEKS